MAHFSKPNFYGNCGDENTGEDLLESPTGGNCTYEGRMEVIIEDLDQDQIKQIDVSKLSGRSYHHPATSIGKKSHQAVHECLLPEASIVSNVALDKAEKKRKVDKAYRERRKKRQLETAQNLVTLSEENKLLKKENESLKDKNTRLTQTLHSQAEELNKHKARLDSFKFEHQKQNSLFQILSDLVVDPDLCHQNKKLKDENAQLREIFKLRAEPLKLVEENGKLQHENLLLKLQIDALCGKIVNENNKNFGHK